jgi:hypothetical protein
MARNASHWTQLFSVSRSGTHNNQWIVIDYNAWNKCAATGNCTGSGTIWMAEEFYYLYKAQDITDTLLLNNGYVASYNVPYNSEVYTVSN